MPHSIFLCCATRTRRNNRDIKMPSKTLLLVGGGHAHIQVIKEFPRLPNINLILVSDNDDAIYSGMLPSVVAGLRNPDDALVNLPQLCDWNGWRFLRGRVVRINPSCNTVNVDTFAFRDVSESVLTLKYDILSLDIGSTTRAIPGVHRQSSDPYVEKMDGVERRVPMVIGTRPIGRLLQAVQQFENVMNDSRNMLQKTRTVFVVGGGAAGVELAFSLHARLHRSLKSGGNIQVVLVSTDGVVSEFGTVVAKTVRGELRERDIMVLQARVEHVDENDGLLRLNDGTVRTFDLLVMATGAASHAWLREKSGLELDEHGFILVDPTLATTRFANVYAVGDCASFGDHFGQKFPPKAGVHAVRQGPVLTANLLTALTDRGMPDKMYKPQSSFLSLLATGDGRAIGTKYGLAFSGTWVYHLKSYIDESWQKRFQIRHGEGKKREGNREKEVIFEGSPAEGAASLLAARDVSTSDAFDVQLSVLRRMDDDPAFRERVVQFVGSKK